MQRFQVSVRIGPDDSGLFGEIVDMETGRAASESVSAFSVEFGRLADECQALNDAERDMMPAWATE